MIKNLFRGFLAAALLWAAVPGIAPAQDFDMQVPGGSSAPAASSGYDYLASQTASTSTQIDVSFDDWPAYRDFNICFYNVLPVTDAVDFLFRVFSDGGTTPDSGASDYSWMQQGASTGAAADTNGNAANTSTFFSAASASNDLGNVAQEGASGCVEILDPANNSAETKFHGWSWHKRASDGLRLAYEYWGARNAVQDTTDVRFVMSSGSIASGVFVLWGRATTSVPEPNVKETMVNVTSITDSPSADANDYSPTGWNGTEPSKATVIRITPTQSIRITGLAGGDGNDARLATLCNTLDGTAGNGELIILEHENASSTAANRFRFADRFSHFLLPDRCISLVYDDTTDRWRTQDDDGWEQVFSVQDDFTGSAGVAVATNPSGTMFATPASGTSADCIAGAHLETSTTQKPQGQLNCDAGSTTTGRIAVQAGRALAGTSPPEQGQAFFLARVAVPDLSDATDEYDIYVGCNDAINGTSATDGFYWLYDRNGSTAWQGASEDAGTQTATGVAGPTVDTNFIWLMIYITGNWDEADYYYSQNGTAWTRAGEQTTNQPEAADMCTFGAVIIGSAGTSQTVRNIVVEWMGFRYDMQRGT